MIQFADKQSRETVRSMWKSCFGDPDDYLDLYFRHKYRDEQTVIYFDGERAVASLQMLPYSFTFHGREIPVLYLSGVCTLPDARRKGFMHQLLLRSFEVARERDIPLMLLVPQEEWLLGYYARYGFAQTFDAGLEPLPSLKRVLDAHAGDLQAAYRAFDALFRGRDMTLQKTFDDFRAMVEEAQLYDYPPKRSLTGMARVIDAERLLSLAAASSPAPEKNISLALKDELLSHNSGIYTLSGGRAERSLLSGQQPVDLDIGMLGQLLLGYHTSACEEPHCSLFPEKTPQMHYMLE